MVETVKIETLFSCFANDAGLVELSGGDKIVFTKSTSRQHPIVLGVFREDISTEKVFFAKQAFKEMSTIEKMGEIKNVILSLPETRGDDKIIFFISKIYPQKIFAIFLVEC